MTLAARGASTARIAATLRISKYTVQNHLSHVFERSGSATAGPWSGGCS